MPSGACTNHLRAPVDVSNRAVIHSAPPTIPPVSATSTPSGLKASDVATSLAKKPVVIMRDQSRTPEELYLCS